MKKTTVLTSLFLIPIILGSMIIVQNTTIAPVVSDSSNEINKVPLEKIDELSPTPETSSLFENIISSYNDNVYPEDAPIIEVFGQKFRVVNDMYIKVEDDSTSPQPASDKPRTGNPTKGDVRMIVLPVDFPDEQHTVSREELDEKFNGETDSFNTFYLENSFGQLNVTSDVMDWVTTPLNKEWYSSSSNNTGEMVMAKYVVNYWEDTVDYSEYDFIQFIYAGENGKDNDHFWPHAWMSNDFETEDVIFGSYAFCGEFNNIGTYTHEFGHQMGLVDYYSVIDGIYYVGLYELMGYGSHGGPDLNGTAPAQNSLYSKIVLGWIKPEEVYQMKVGEITNLNLVPLETSGEVDPENGYYYGAIYWAPNGNYYYVEYRDAIYSDQYLPDNGLMWYRVDPRVASTEGRLWYMGGDHSTAFLDGAAIESDDYTNDEPFTAWLDDTKNAEFSVSMIDEFEVAGDHPQGVNIILDSKYDYGSEWEVVEDVSAQTYHNWTFENLEQDQIIHFRWDTEEETTTSDMTLFRENGVNWDVVVHRDDLYQDAFQYRIETAGTYRLGIFNDNPSAPMDIQYLSTVYSAPEYNISIDSPEKVYLNKDDYVEFNVKAVVKNEGEAWQEFDGEVYAETEIAFPAFIDVLDNLTHQFNQSIKLPVYYGHKLANEYKVSAEAIGNYTFDFTFNTSEVALSVSEEVEVIYDTIAPTLTLQNEETMLDSDIIELKWDVSEYESGLAYYEFYINGSLYEKLTSLVRSHQITLPEEEGYYNVSMRVYDKAGNYQEEEIIVFYENTPPEISGIAGLPQTAEGDYPIIMNITEERTPPVNLKVYIGDGSDAYVNTVVEEADFINYEVVIRSADLKELEIEEGEKITIYFNLFDQIGNSYLRQYFITVEYPSQGIPGYSGVFVIAALSIAAILVKKRK